MSGFMANKQVTLLGILSVVMASAALMLSLLRLFPDFFGVVIDDDGVAAKITYPMAIIGLLLTGWNSRSQARSSNDETQHA